MKVEPYLSFEGRCDEAIEFYKNAVDARVEMIMRFKEMPGGGEEAKMPAHVMDKVMHASLRIGDSVVMATDGHCAGAPNFSGISLSLSVSDEDEARRRFDALGKGGKVTMPLSKTFFASSFGMVTDPFGISWMIIAHA